ncbi:uncharacterized protein P174DRAFT_353692, partial [Aspergillus novofumigatus IBT 16806]
PNTARPCRATLSPRKSAQQKGKRRKIGLMKKAYEYSELCNADICVGIRLREFSHIFTFLSDPTRFWSTLDSLLATYYPLPVRQTGENFKS